MTEIKEWHFTTECKRNFVWSAYDLDQLLRDIIRAGYRATFIEEYHDTSREAQEVLNAEIKKAAEETAA